MPDLHPQDDGRRDVLSLQLAELLLPSEHPQRVRGPGLRTRGRVAGDGLRLQPRPGGRTEQHLAQAVRRSDDLQVVAGAGLMTSP